MLFFKIKTQRFFSLAAKTLKHSIQCDDQVLALNVPGAPFLESLGNFYVLTSNEVHFVSLADNFTV